MATAAPPDPARIARWRFGNCVLDALSLTLTVDGTPVEIEPKPLSLLLFLLRHPAEVLTKDELQAEVWPGRVLSDSVLTKTMAVLRQALGTQGPGMIKTVHGLGYRLDAAVTVETLIDEAPATPTLAPGYSPPLRPHWQLVRPLGHGGFGEAWLARHQKTGDERVFKFAVDADGLGGLKREITLYRVMTHVHGDHPGLIQILDWNLEQLPFFIEADHVAGGSLLDWSRSMGGLELIDPAIKIDLAIQIADTLAAAHLAGVLHKDLKPANILVDNRDPARLQIKLGDFGSGRIIEADAARQLNITRLGFTQTVADNSNSGTPLYLAPELLAGQQPTVQSDIYALGVIIYQLQVSDFQRPLAPGWELEITDPVLADDIAASAALRTENRLSSAADLARRLRTLDARRRQRAEQQQQTQREQQRREAERRWQLRRKWLTALTIVLTLGLGASLWFATQARYAAKRADEQARQAAATSKFLTDILDSNNVATLGDRAPGSLTAREIAELMLTRADAEFADQPKVLLDIVDRGYLLHYSWAEYAKAMALLERMVRLNEQIYGATSAEHVRALIDLARMRLVYREFEHGGSYDTATPLKRAAELIDQMGARGSALESQWLRVSGRDALPPIGRADRSLDAFTRATELDRKIETPTVIARWNRFNLCVALATTDQLDEARRCHSDNIAQERQRPGQSFGGDSGEMRNDVMIGVSLQQRAVVEYRSGDADAAEASATEAEAVLRAIDGGESPYYIDAVLIRANTRAARGDIAAALQLIDQASQRLRVLKQRRPDARPEMLRLTRARLMLAQGDAAGAEAILVTLRNTHVLGQPPLPLTDGDFALSHGVALERLGRLQAAEQAYDEAVAAFAALGHPEAESALEARVQRAEFQLRHGADAQAAIDDLRDVVAIASRQAAKPVLARAQLDLAEHASVAGAHTVALQLIEQAQKTLDLSRSLGSAALKSELSQRRLAIIDAAAATTTR
ncbi:Serine/threonine protein kinase [Hydrocarboniphaga daqingensis]|uniref:Serine/threonine protein kinase n=1 Tax=Hydrocarboniphaga daqingensis TaxID=490188 RepID=A0A1M5KN81_9GAMM|nr:protein kinase [Hydrocarboniphaga daqingensis]SHG53959.1 Serine/threonine protein kinase [Hydrocarboniphaga daqingensis]